MKGGSLKPLITFCLMSCGEPTEKACLRAIEPFRDKIVLQEVRNVYPQIRALNQMLRQADTEYLIPLDADMVLNENAYPRIMQAITKHACDANWHTLLFKLWDTLTEKEILALKILRTQIMHAHPFVESATPDVEHFQRLTKQGYTCITQYLNTDPIGKHIVRGKHFCYNKYRDVYQTYKSHGREWDSGVFMGGQTLLERAKKHFDYFLFKYLMTDKKDYLWCIAGMLDGIKSPIEHRSKTLQPRKYLYTADSAIHHFYEWYIPHIHRVIF